jgi:hypothetical protein
MGSGLHQIAETARGLADSSGVFPDLSAHAEPFADRLEVGQFQVTWVGESSQIRVSRR